jgi:hypothetical protein
MMPVKAGLEGSAVSIVVSDPWEFGTEHGTGPFEATIVLIEPDPNPPGRDPAALIQLRTALKFAGTSCEYFVAQPRHEGTSLGDLFHGPLNCNLTAISSERATGASPLDLSWWRGGVVLLGSMSCAPRVHTPVVQRT